MMKSKPSGYSLTPARARVQADPRLNLQVRRPVWKFDLPTDQINLLPAGQGSWESAMPGVLSSRTSNGPHENPPNMLGYAVPGYAIIPRRAQ